ncbi:MAG: aspartate aminotransferase family protein, partial [bacterium]
MTDLGPGVSAATAREELRALRADDPPVHGGRVLAYVYDAGVEAAVQAGREALAEFGELNALDPLAFPSVARLENSLVGWGLELMRAPDGAVGTVTSGGTESCILAVLASRDRGATILLAETAHPAFHKAAHLLGLRTRVLPVDPETLRLTGAAVAAPLDEEGDVALVVASAPSYAHGVVDEIEGIAAACAARGVPC